MRALIVLPAYLGDTVFLGPAVRALKARWPDGEVTLCVSPRGAPVARLLPGCDAVVVYDKRGADAGLGGFRRVAAALRARRPELALVPHPSLRSGALAWASGARRRVGWAPLCTERAPPAPGDTFVERSLRLAARAGAPAVGAALALRAPADPAGYADRVLAGSARPLLGLVPGAEWATKRWGAGRFAALARALLSGGGTAVVLGGPAERALGAEVCAALGGDARDATGNTLDEALALLARCDLVVGGDTGLLHCARALGRRALLLFGPTDAARHRLGPGQAAVATAVPCRPCHEHGPARCPLGHHACMADLAPEAVAAAARALLDAPGG